MRVPIAIENCGFAPVGIHDSVTLGDLTTGKPGLKYVKFRRKYPLRLDLFGDPPDL